MKTPTIHLNGTSADALLSQYAAAYKAVDDALNALAQSAPHGRDYYVQEQNAYEEAREEHRERLNKLRHVRGELVEIMRSIETQAQARQKK